MVMVGTAHITSPMSSDPPMLADPRVSGVESGITAVPRGWTFSLLAVCTDRTKAWSAADHWGMPTAWMLAKAARSEEHTSELQSLMRTSYAVFCLKKKNNTNYDIDKDNTI